MRQMDTTAPRELTTRQLRVLLFNLPYEPLWEARRAEVEAEYLRRVKERELCGG